MNPDPLPDDDIDFSELVAEVWNRRWLVAVTVGVVTSVALVISLMIPNVYKAEAVLAPNQSEGGSTLADLAGRYGSLAGLAGIDLNNRSSDKTAIGLEILKSRKFISDFVERRDILVPLIAARGWDVETGELEIDASIYDVKTGEWTRQARAPRSARPSRQEAYEAFSDNNLSVSQDKNTGFVTVTVRHYSPQIAKRWVDWIIEDINSTVMQRDVEEAQQAIEYLKSQIEATPLTGLQNVFFRLIEEQTKTVMLAKVSREYLFRTIDPAVVPELKESPKRAIITIFGAMTGVALSLIIVVILRSRAAR